MTYTLKVVNKFVDNPSVYDVNKIVTSITPSMPCVISPTPLASYTLALHIQS